MCVKSESLVIQWLHRHSFATTSHRVPPTIIGCTLDKTAANGPIGGEEKEE